MPFCILSTADEPSLRCQILPCQIVHPLGERTDFLKVCISLWLFHSVCCDAGTGGQPCVEIQALYSPRQLLEWVWIYQPVICAMPLPTPSPSLHPHPPPRINDCLSSFAPNHDQDAEAIENVYFNCKNPPCFTKWPVFTLMGLLITATLFMCVLNWRWA